MLVAFDPLAPRDPELARTLRSYALGTTNANLKQMLLRIAAEYDAETARLVLLPNSE